MNIPAIPLAILALLATSVLVRILPVFLRRTMSEAARDLLERVLPTAVFLNFAVYIVYSEVKTAPLPALVALGVLAWLAFRTRAGLILAACAASSAYALLVLAAV